MSYIVIIHKAILVSSGNRSSRASRHLCLLFTNTIRASTPLGLLLTNMVFFREHGTLWKQKFQNAALPTYRNGKFSNCCTFFTRVLSKLRLEILKSEILMIFFFISVNMGPNWSETFKKLLLLHIAAKRFQACSEFYFQWSLQN